MSRGPFQPGDVCNQYKIVRSLGVGGFGHVYEAVRQFKMLAGGILQPFGQNVALKCLVTDQADDPDRLQRLNLEAVLLLQLKHPNIVGFVDWGITDDGTAFFAMELLKGKNLSQALKERRFSVARALYVAAEIAEGMAYAHEQGVVHRDLKPGNVFVTEQWEIKVLDLGAAKYRLPLNPPTDSKQLPPCTITYAAPEQLRNSKEVDGKADVFALGIIAYQMLTAHHPFCEGARTLDEQVSRQLECAAQPLTDRGVPAYIGEVVHRALRKNASERPTMAELRDELRAVYSKYVGEGAYEDAGLAQIVERRTRRTRMQNGESDPLGVPVVKNDAVTAVNQTPRIDSKAPTKPVVDGFSPTEFVDLAANASPPSNGTHDAWFASTRTARGQEGTPTVPVATRPRARRGAWAAIGKFYERMPRAVPVAVGGALLLPIGLVLASYARRAEVHAEPAPVRAPIVQEAAPPPPVPESVVEAEPAAEEAPAPARPAPKPRKSALHGIHTPKWDNLSANKLPTVE
jgi:serine/threonine protein kinase